jgi:hypothetical protein
MVKHVNHHMQMVVVRENRMIFIVWLSFQSVVIILAVDHIAVSHHASYNLFPMTPEKDALSIAGQSIAYWSQSPKVCAFENCSSINPSAKLPKSSDVSFPSGNTES